MTIQVICPACGKGLKAPDAAAGKKAKCPKCGSLMLVPTAEEILETQMEQLPPVSAPASAGSDLGSLLDEDNAYGLAQPSASAGASAAAESRRPCPVCGEMIISTAAKCRFCGEVFDNSLPLSGGSGRAIKPVTRELISRFHDEMSKLGGMWVLLTTLSALYQIGLLFYNGVYQRVTGPYFAGMIVGVLIAHSLGFVLGMFTCAKHIWPVWILVILTYPGVLLMLLATFLLTRVASQAPVSALIQFAITWGVLAATLFWGHRCISAAIRMRRAGISLTEG